MSCVAFVNANVVWLIGNTSAYTFKCCEWTTWVRRNPHVHHWRTTFLQRGVRRAVSVGVKSSNDFGNTIDVSPTQVVVNMPLK